MEKMQDFEFNAVFLFCQYIGLAVPSSFSLLSSKRKIFKSDFRLTKEKKLAPPSSPPNFFQKKLDGKPGGSYFLTHQSPTETAAAASLVWRSGCFLCCRFRIACINRSFVWPGKESGKRPASLRFVLTPLPLSLAREYHALEQWRWQVCKGYYLHTTAILSAAFRFSRKGPLFITEKAFYFKA